MDADYQGIFVAIVGFAVLFLVLRGVYSFFAGFVQGYRSSHSQPPKPHAATPTERTQYARPAARVDRGTAPVPSRIFLSYRRTDSADVTGRIFDRLSVQFAKEKIFKDVDSIPLGVDFRTYIDRSPTPPRYDAGEKRYLAARDQRGLSAALYARDRKPGIAVVGDSFQ